MRDGMLKRALAVLTAMMLLIGCIPAAVAEGETTEATEAPIYDYEELTVAVTTPMTGNFFTSLWGNGSSDIDVRMLLHGYNLVEWHPDEVAFMINHTVVSGLVATGNSRGDRSYKLGINPDLTYSDGTPITAWDYAFSILLTMAPEMAEIGGSVKKPEYLLGYEEYISGESKELAGVRVLADDMLEITVKGEYLPFFYELGLLDCNPYPIGVIAPGVSVADDGQGVYFTEPLTAEMLRETVLDPVTGYRTHPTVTSGPYTLVSYEDGKAEFARNPLFKGNANGTKPVFERLYFCSMPNEELIPALQEGTIGIANKVMDEDAVMAGLALDPDAFRSTTYPRTGLSFISFCTERPAMADVETRQALAYLIDRELLTMETAGDSGVVVEGYCGIGQWIYQLITGMVAWPEGQEPGEEDPITLEEIPAYAVDTKLAAQLLNKAGWSLNEQGKTFKSGKDALRFRKNEEGKLEPLTLTLAYPENSAAGPALEKLLPEELSAAGIGITIEAMPMAELLQEYYNTVERSIDMIFMATNFDILFDPSVNFRVNEEGKHEWINSSMEDEKLYRLAVEMRQTEPGDYLGYCRSWLEFQKEIMTKLPMLPIYTNLYYDFYPRVLHEYNISSIISWARAVLPAYMSDVVEPLEEEIVEIP